MGFPLAQLQKGLLDGQRALQQALHWQIVAAKADAADEEQAVAPGDQRIDFDGVVPNHAASGRPGPAGKAAGAGGDFAGGQIDKTAVCAAAEGSAEGAVGQYQMHKDPSFVKKWKIHTPL